MYDTMKNYFYFFLSVFTFFSCASEDVVQTTSTTPKSYERKVSGATENMLWNHRMTKRSWMHTSVIDGQAAKSIRHASTLQDLVGNPANIYPLEYLTYNEINNVWTPEYIHASNYSAPSTTWVSYNYSVDHWREYPGFDKWIFDGAVAGDPLIFQFANNAKYLNDNFTLHEVGFVFQHWFQEGSAAEFNQTGGWWSFRQQYKLSDFSEIKPFFKVKLNNYDPIETANPNKGAYITCDFRYVYFDPVTKQRIRSDFVGVVFCISPGLDFDGNSLNHIVWKSFTPESNRILLLASKINIPYLNIANLSERSSYKDITYNILNLITQYNPPPPGYTIEDAYLDGYDIYSASRGADIQFWITDIQLNGKWK
jgi:hypothetical protein